MESYINLPQNIRNKLLYNSTYIKSPFNKKNKILYADFIASGLPSPYIEDYIKNNIYPLYSNTHSNASNGILMKNLICDTKKYIRKIMKLKDEHKIIFPGSGTTSAINLLVNCIDYKKYKNVYIFLTIYEHYSNHTPWVELTKTHSNIDIIYIPLIDNKIDLNYFDNNLNNIYNKSNNTLVICSISACSNINGLITPFNNIFNILSKYPNNHKFYKYLFADFACNAPYVDINGSMFDALFFSPHKFIGGMSTPGVLIGRKCLFSKKAPYSPGGGCVINASYNNVIYEDDIERKELGGTPNIIGIIKIKKVLELKEIFKYVIKNNEKILTNFIKSKINYFKNKYDTFKAVLYNDDTEHLPILSFHLTNLHYNFIVILFNDLFGIQTRGGIGCCGLLAEYIEKKYAYRGWCRISFHWSMSKKIYIIFLVL